MNLKTAVLTAAAMALGTALANAETPAPQWTLMKDTRDIKPGPLVYAHDPAGYGVLLKCSQDSVSIGFTIEPRDITRIVGKAAPRLQQRDLSVTFEDGSEKKLPAVYVPFYRTVMSGDRTLAAKVFSGALKGERLTVEVQRRDKVEIQLPDRNEDLDAFIAGCPLVK